MVNLRLVLVATLFLGTAGAAAQPLTAAVDWGDGESYYFFAGDHWFNYRKSKKQADPPKPISGSWDCVHDPVDAAFRHGRKIYLFFGAKYAKYDTAKNKCDDGYPKLIKGNWKKVPWDRIEAAESYNGKAYLFNGGQYARFDIARDEADFVKPVADGWPKTWDKDIDLSVNWGDGNLYLFRGGEFFQYSIGHETGVGAPQLVRTEWVGLLDDESIVATADAYRRRALAFAIAELGAILKKPAAELSRSHARSLKALKSWLNIAPGDPNFLTHVSTARANMEKNQARTDPRSAAGAGICKTSSDNACYRWDTKTVQIPPKFLVLPWRCQRVVIIHEYYHPVFGPTAFPSTAFPGAADQTHVPKGIKYPVRKTADSLKDPNYMAGLTSELYSGEEDSCP